VGYPAQPLRVGDVFESDQIEYLHLYLLVVRALRLCDQRSVQLEKIKVITLNQQEGDTLFIAIRKNYQTSFCLLSLNTLLSPQLRCLQVYIPVNLDSQSGVYRDRCVRLLIIPVLQNISWFNRGQ